MRTIPIALHVFLIILHTVDRLILKLAAIVVCASPVTQYRKVTASLSLASTDSLIFVDSIEIYGAN